MKNDQTAPTPPPKQAGAAAPHSTLSILHSTLGDRGGGSAGAPIAILGTGSCDPARVVTNDDLARAGLDTSDEWIRTRTGINSRHIAAPDEATSDLATAAARAALDDARLTPADIDLIIVATLTPDMIMPATATLVQKKLGARDGIPAFDLNAACTGFLYALDTAWAMVASGRYRHALVIGAEKLSAVTDWQDRNTCVLFGDGAGAAVLGAARPRDDTARESAARGRESGGESGSGTQDSGPRTQDGGSGTQDTGLRTPDGGRGMPEAGILGVRLYCTPNAGLIRIPVGGAERPHTADTYAQRQHYIQMNGKEVFKIAVREMERAAREILEQHHLATHQIACVIPHQANRRIIEAVARNLDYPLERIHINLDRHGNTSAASIPIALDEARRAGRIHPGDLTLLFAFGAGLTYGSALIRW